MGFESLRRHPDSGVFLLRKRVPARLKQFVGKGEIKLSLGTTDRKVARIRCLEELAKIERAWSGFDAAIIDGDAQALARLQCKFSGETTEANGVPTASRGPVADPSTNPSRPNSSTSNPSPSGAAAATVGDVRAPVSIRHVFASYAKEAQLSHGTVKRWTPVVDRLTGRLEGGAYEAFEDCVDWKRFEEKADALRREKTDEYLEEVEFEGEPS